MRAGAGGAVADTGISLAGITYTVENVAPAGSMTCNVPTEVEDGMQMLLHLVIQDDLDLTAQPIGWTRIPALDITQMTGDDLRTNVYRRTARSEPASYEVFSNHAASLRILNVAISVWNNVAPGTFDVTPVSGHAAVTNDVVNPSNPAITSANDGAMMVCFAGYGFTALTLAGAQAGYTLEASDISLVVSGELSTKKIASAGLETPGAWTNTSGGLPESVHNSLLLKPLAAPDPDFASVVLLLDFSGADGDTNIVDLSNSAHVDTFVANAEVDTAISALATNTLLLDGTGDYIHFPDSADWDFGTGDFTVECSFQSAADLVTAALISNRLDASDGWSIHQQSGGNLRWLDGDTEIKSETWNPTEGVMYHVAVCRSGTSLRMFIDGTEIGTATTDSTDITGSTTPLAIGALPIPAQHVNGSIGAVRITKGVARYTANFTAPTEFYPTS